MTMRMLLLREMRAVLPHYRLWYLEIIPDPKHRVARTATGTHTADVESRAAVLRGGGTHTYSGGRGYLLPDWSIETGCPHLIDRFSWKGHYYQRAYRSTLCIRDRYVGEEDSHQGSDE